MIILNKYNNNIIKLKEIKLSYTSIPKPFGQIRSNALELLAISTDFAQFNCAQALTKIALNFWNEFLNLCFIHKNNNFFYYNLED